MPISYDGKLYEDEFALETGKPLEARTDDKSSGGTQVPSKENNASAASVEPPRGIVDKLLGQTGERYITWPEKAIRTMIGAAALPGEVAQGQIDPSSTIAIEKAADLAGLAVLGPAPVARAMSDGTLGSFVGVKSKSFDRNSLAEAQIMKSKGATPDEIWDKTKTFQGADGRWKQEIPDNAAKLKLDKFDEYSPSAGWTSTDGLPVISLAGRNQTLKDIYDHPELYKAYPDLANIKVEPTPLFDRSLGSYSRGNDTIYLSKTSEENMKSTLMHEIQHAIQAREGFSFGGAPAALKPQNYKAMETEFSTWKDSFYSDLLNTKKVDSYSEIYQLQTALSKYKDFLDGKLPKSWDKEFFKEMYGTELNKIHDLGIARDLLKATQGEDIIKRGDQEAYRLYSAIKGEVEARNVQARNLLKDYEKKIYSPQKTEDHSRIEQIPSPFD